VGDPLAYVFGPEGANVHWISGFIGISAIVAIFTVLLVFQLGQPRIWMAMSRDGLLPKVFSKLHPKYKTPSFSTIVTGLFVGIPCMFMNLTEVTDLCSIGTLFAFILVCAGVLRMDPNRPKVEGRFYTPYINGKYWFTGMVLLTVVLLMLFNADSMKSFFTYESWDSFRHKIPLWFFIIGMGFLTMLTYVKNLSLIPLLGLASCGYLMTELGWTNWLRFGIWLAVGLVIYFLYGHKNSKLSAKSQGV
jgi:amino acid transporter